jgi:hypothetical protein
MAQEDVTTNVRPTSAGMVIIVIMSIFTSFMLLPLINTPWLRHNIPVFFTLLPSIMAISYGCYIFGIVEHGFQNVKSCSKLMERRDQLERERRNLESKLKKSGRKFTEAYDAWAAADEVHKDEILKHRNETSEKWWTVIQEIAGVKRELQAVQGEIRTKREMMDGEIEKLER